MQTKNGIENGIMEKTVEKPVDKGAAIRNTKFFVGGIAGSFGSIGTHPLDLIKVRLQVAKTYSETSALEGAAAATKPVTSLGGIVKDIWRKEKVVGFYRGLSASVMRQMTWSSLRFNIYFVLKEKLAARSKTGKVGILPEMGCALTSGAIGAVAGSPFDLINIRMQSNSGMPAHLQRYYRNVFDGVWKVITTEGAATLFKGLATNVQRAMTITAMQLVSYDRAKSYILASGYKDNIFTHFLSSMLAGFATVTVSNPIDVVRSVLMSSPKGKYKSGADCFLQLYRNNGALYFMKGWTPSYVRVGPHTVITFIALEQLKNIPILQKAKKV